MLEEIKEISRKIEEEIRETGIPIVLPAFSSCGNYNLPRQLKFAKILMLELEENKYLMIESKDKLYEICHEMYKEEMGDSFKSINDNAFDPFPNWIHELFNSGNLSLNSSNISNLDAAIDQLNPFSPSLSDSLAKLEDAHTILTGRLEIFKAEFETLWKDVEELYEKLYPFDDIESTEDSSKIINYKLSEQSNENIPSRSVLRKVSSEWRRIEKDRTESISGSILLIGRLWNLLETPNEERFELSPTDISIKNIKKLSKERHRLINFQQQKFKELYDSQVQELKKIMTSLKWSKCKQESLLESCQSYTADGLQFLSIQLAALQPKLESSLNIISAVECRYNLIEKMREFEKSASDPARLFRSSFQLLQEEKFRKTALPNLLNIENQLKGFLTDFKTKFSDDFIYSRADDLIDDTPYINLLEDEISSRFMSSGIFGFDQTKQRKERLSSIPSTSSPRYLSNRKQSGSSSPPTAGINVIPQRRKLDK